MPERSRRRVVFVNEASASIGMGHILRSQVLARGMHLRGYAISGITIGDERAVSYATERARQDGFEWPIRLAQNVQAAIEQLLQDAPPVIVVDCAIASADIVQACAGKPIAVVVLDYFLAEPPLPTAVINLIDHNPGTLAGHPPDREGVAYFEGPQYAIIRDEFRVAREYRMQRGEHASIGNILVAFGGADPSGNSQRALEMITQWPGRFHIDLVIGPLFNAAIEQLAEKFQHKCVLKTHASPSYLGKLFDEADVVFCGGGGTLLEALCVGVPAIVIAQNDAEYRHAQSLAQRGACWLLDQSEWTLLNAAENREQLSKCARACVDGRGADRICDVIEQQSN